MTDPSYNRTPVRSLDPGQVWADFVWSVTSPDLLTFSDQSPLPPEVPYLALRNGQARLVEHLERRFSHRVGDYFESLVEFQLENTPGVHELRRRVALRDEQRTLGELDFLFRDATGMLHHWEVAVKFYLFTDTPNSQGSHLPGPDARDFCERKWQRLVEHQLPLIQLLHGQPLDLEPIQRRAIVKGAIFYPWPADVDSLAPPADAAQLLPDYVNRSCEIGWWLPARRVAEFVQTAAADQYRILQKPFWLAIAAHPSGSGCDGRKLIPQVTEHFGINPSRPLHLAVDLTAAGTVRRLSRIMIVPDHWPNETSS